VIFVEGLTHRRAIWGDELNAHIVSDVSIAELKAFGRDLGIPDYWLQAFPVPHYELSVHWRHRALKAGAMDCSGLDRAQLYVEALRRYVATHPEVFGRRYA
jgi:hypothetical protein